MSLGFKIDNIKSSVAMALWLWLVISMTFFFFSQRSHIHYVKQCDRKTAISIYNFESQYSVQLFNSFGCSYGLLEHKGNDNLVFCEKESLLSLNEYEKQQKTKQKKQGLESDFVKNKRAG